MSHRIVFVGVSVGAHIKTDRHIVLCLSMFLSEHTLKHIVTSYCVSVGAHIKTHHHIVLCLSVFLSEHTLKQIVTSYCVSVVRQCLRCRVSLTVRNISSSSLVTS